MLIIPYILCILYILFIKKNTKYTWIFAASAMALLSITSANYADLSNYIPLFDYINCMDLSVAAQTTGIGWICINKFFYMIGMNYRGLVVCMLYINYFLMHLAIRRFNVNENLYFGLFLIFPAIIQLVQFKFFTAFCVSFLGYSLLITSEYYSNVKYTIYILVASLIHTSNIVFLLFLLIKTKIYQKKTSFLFLLITTLIVMLCLNPIVSIVSRYLNPKLVDRYLTDSITPSSVMWIIAIFLVWVISFAISKFVLSKKIFACSQTSCDNSINNKADYCGKTIEILLITLPFLLLDRNFHRFLEMGYSVLFIILGMNIAPPRYSRTKINFIFAIIVLLTLVSCIYCPFETVLEPIFSFDGFVDLRR